MNTPNMLEKVVDELHRRKGEMRKVALETGLSYDTVLRIRNNEVETAFSKVQTLHDYLFSETCRYCNGTKAAHGQP